MEFLRTQSGSFFRRLTYSPVALNHYCTVSGASATALIRSSVVRIPTLVRPRATGDPPVQTKERRVGQLERLGHVGTTSTRFEVVATC